LIITAEVGVKNIKSPETNPDTDHPLPEDTSKNKNMNSNLSNNLSKKVLSLEAENQLLKEQNAILKQRDIRFQLISINSPDTIMFQNKDLVYTWVINSSPLMTVDQIIGKTDYELLSPEEAKRVGRIKKELLKSGSSFYEEIVSETMGSRHYFSMFYQAWRDSSGNILGIATYTRDINEKKIAEDNLRKQLEGEELVANISSQFIKAEIAHIDEEIPAALQKMANYLDADRGFIRFIDPETNLIQSGFQWTDPSLTRSRIEIAGIPVTRFQWSYNQLKDNHPIYISESASIPLAAAPEKSFLLSAGYKSIVMVPMFIFNKFSGYIGFGSEKSHPFWSEREKGLLDLFSSTIVNVLERQQREAAFNENQELYQNLVNLSPNTIFLIQDRKILFINPAGVKITGLNSSVEVLGKSIGDIFPPETLEINEIATETLRQKMGASPVETTIRNKKGDTVTLEIKTIPIKINGQPATLGVGTDITDRKEKEKEIERNRYFLNNILDIAPLGIFVFDWNEDRLVFFNEASGNIFGFSKQHENTYSRQMIMDMLDPIILEGPRSSSLNLKSMPIGQVLENEYKILLPGGGLGWLNVYQTPVSKSEDGTVHQSLTIVQDVTEIKKAQEELLESEKKYRGLVETIPGVVYRVALDEHFSIIYISDYFEKLTSINKKEILENQQISWMDLVHPEDQTRVQIGIKNAVTSRTSFYFEFRLRKADGEYIWVSNTGLGSYDENNRPRFIHGLMADISDRKRDYEEMRRLSQENFRLMAKAYHDSETKTLLLNEVNHRVKNNLASILGILELEKKRDIKTSTDFQDALSDIESRISGLAKVHEILSSNQWAPVQLDVLMKKVIENASSTSPIGRKLHINIKSTDRRLWINSRQATALALVVNELTTNSIRHAFSNRDRGSITVTIQMEDKKSHLVKIEFADDGVGWPEGILAGGSGGVGMQVIKLSVSSPLNGKIKFENHDGAVAIITFNLAPQRDFPPSILPETS
jgi:PAS domain S-box-containing protein